ncbi:DUF4293 domain-containing protein [Coprobacter tertius]|uniref:DUF4293 domain-containing protein n=1 Tax=Coprobacter tertius TaxID=2944915 RepID=A0ABT1MHP9_9BACT|nr:DUF4293 domain-containing protein [Coprobacter tertius]MCP9612140.1 DUF4293 domain-containing protein [Coprobacter tertius]
MIQRIQSFYLLLVALLMATVIFMPLTSFNTIDASYEFLPYGVVSMGIPSKMVLQTWPLAALAALSAILSFLAIFMYKKRTLQMKCCTFVQLLIFAFYIVFFSFWWLIQKDFQIANPTLDAALTMPIVALILCYIARRKIKQDEMLVRSADRIR